MSLVELLTLGEKRKSSDGGDYRPPNRPPHCFPLVRFRRRETRDCGGGFRPRRPLVPPRPADRFTTPRCAGRMPGPSPPLPPRSGGANPLVACRTSSLRLSHPLTLPAKPSRIVGISRLERDRNPFPPPECADIHGKFTEARAQPVKIVSFERRQLNGIDRC